MIMRKIKLFLILYGIDLFWVFWFLVMLDMKLKFGFLVFLLCVCLFLNLIDEYDLFFLEFYEKWEVRCVEE